MLNNEESHWRASAAKHARSLYARNRRTDPPHELHRRHRHHLRRISASIPAMTKEECAAWGNTSASPNPVMRAWSNTRIGGQRMTEVAPLPSSAPVSWVAASRTLPLSAVIAHSRRSSANALRKARLNPRQLDQAVELGKVNAAEANAAFARIEYAARLTKPPARRSRHRSRPEEMESKIEIFTMLDKICRPPRFSLEYVLAQRHRNRQRHLSRQKMRRHALFQSRAQDEAARNRARP